MKQRLTPGEISKIQARFKEITYDQRLKEDIIESYTESRDNGDGVYFHTEELEELAQSYIKAVDIIRYVAKNDSSDIPVSVLEILRPLRYVERVIEDYYATLKEFRAFMYEELRDAIEPFEDLMIDVVNWVASSIYNQSADQPDDITDEEED